MTKVVTTDLQALNYVLSAPEFEKTDEGRELLGDILGKGRPNCLGTVTIQ